MNNTLAKHELFRSIFLSHYYFNSSLPCILNTTT